MLSKADPKQLGIRREVQDEGKPRWKAAMSCEDGIWGAEGSHEISQTVHDWVGGCHM